MTEPICIMFNSLVARDVWCQKLFCKIYSQSDQSAVLSLYVDTSQKYNTDDRYDIY